MFGNKFFVVLMVFGILLYGCTEQQTDSKAIESKITEKQSGEIAKQENIIAEKEEDMEGQAEEMATDEIKEKAKEMMDGIAPEGMMKQEKVIEVTAKQWEFQPSEIKVKQGEDVTLIVKSIDVKHGIWIPELDLNENLDPGKEVKLKINTDNKGTFQMICSVQCGAGHPNMKGKIIVE